MQRANATRSKTKQHRAKPMKHTARQLALVLGVQPSTVTRDIKKGKISATKNERGEYEIDASEIARAYADRITVDDAGNILRKGEMQNDATPENGNANSLLRQEVEFLREKLSDLNRLTDKERQQLFERIEDLRNERDRLLKVIEEQAGSFRLLTDQRQQQQPEAAPPPPPRKGLRGWLHRMTA